MRKTFSFLFLLLCFLKGQSQTADFSITSAGGNFCAPANIQFASIVTGTPTAYLWTFDDGGYWNTANVNKSYTTAGTFGIKLTVIYPNNVIEVSKSVTINPGAVVSIVPDRNYICKPGQVTFTAPGNIGSGTYVWNFGDTASPVTTNTNIITHNYTTFGNYQATVTGTSPFGCTSSASVSIRVAPPDISATVSRTEGCVPAVVNFASIVTVPAGGSVTSYLWNFGNGSTTTTSGTTSTTYALPGTYNTSVTVTTNEGCTNSFTYSPIAFGVPPTNNITRLSKDTICSSDTLAFFGKATNANAYNWQFGDGNSITIPDTIALHKYRTLGRHMVFFTPWYNGCRGTTDTLTSFVNGAIALFSYTNTCTNKQTFTFVNNSVGRFDSSLWNMGDGTTFSNRNNFSHSYTNTGNYTASLAVYDSVSGCADTALHLLYYALPSLISNDTLVCKGDSVDLAINSNYLNPQATYTWQIAGDPLGPNNNSIINRFPTRHHGIFTNYVIINNGTGYCSDTVIQAKPVRVRGIVVDYTVADSTCQNSTVQITNLSKPFYPSDAIAGWHWSFGNGSSDTAFHPNPQPYNGNGGNYQVIAWGIDQNGCKDSLYKNINVVSLPFIETFPKTDTICFGQVISIYAFHSDSIRWTPANLVSCTNCDTTRVSPPTTTVFKAIAINHFGCTNTDSVVVRVFSPFVASTSFTDTAICLNESIRLMTNPTDKKVLWIPATSLSSATIHNPVATPVQTTRYRVALTDSAGCFTDTTALTIRVKSLPTVDAGPTQTYPYFASFQFAPVYSANVVGYNWTPGNTLSCTNCPVPTGRNEISRFYQVTVTSDSGCTATDSVHILVDCKDAYLLMPTAFTPNNDGLNDYYYPLTRGVSIVKNLVIYNRVGQVVFQAKDFKPNDKRFGWDGRFKGEPQDIGTFVYMMEAVCDAGQTLTRKGSFMLLQ